MAYAENLNQISLRIMVDKEINKVLFAEAGKEFVDIVISFLIMPLGTIARLVGKDSNLKGFQLGSITSLYRSVQNLDTKYFCTDTFKHMLLHPRNPMESHCQNLNINIDDTEPTKYFTCEECYCKMMNVVVSTFSNRVCHCGRIMSKKVECADSIREGQICNGYVQDVSFVIFDDLTVKPLDGFSTLGLLRNHCIKKGSPLPSERIVKLTQNQVVDLLKCSLFSNTPLTDCILRQKQYPANPITHGWCSFIKEETVADGNDKKVKVKLMLSKSTSKILYAQVGGDFMDLLFSFLTFPLCLVEHVLHGNSSLGCIDKFYNSVITLETKYFKSEEIKSMFINPVVAPHFKVITCD